MDYKADYIYKLTNLPIDVYIDLDSQKIFVNKKWYSFQIPNVPFECLCVLAYNCGIVLSPGQIIQSHKEWGSTQYTLEAEDNILISKTISKIHVVLRKVLLETLGEENIKTLLEIDSIDKLIIIKTHKKTGYQFLAERIPKDKFLRSNEYNDDNKKTDSPFTESLYTILSATLPNRRETNTTNKPITVTRYALFTLINHLYPNETELLEFLSDGTQTPEELNSRISTIEILNPILSSLTKNIVFELQINDSNKNRELVIIKSKNNFVKPISNEQYKSALDLLVKAYSALPQEFHNNIKSILKREINTTISEFVLAVANMGIFNKSEHSRAELLTICDNLAKTHNHHNSYLYALIEKTRNGENYLFKEFSSEDFECMRAIEIIKNFFYDNWLTEQSTSYIGTKFLLWCNDKKIIFDLINNHCYDQNIWLEFAKKYKGNNTLRQKVRSEIYKKTDLKTKAYINDVTSFLQMIAKGNFKFLAHNQRDTQFNSDVQTFIVFILENISFFPVEDRTMLVKGFTPLLANINGYDPNHEYFTTKKILSQLKIDWSNNCYDPLKEFKNQISGESMYVQPILDECNSAIIDFQTLSTEEKSNPNQLKEITKKLRILMQSKTYTFNFDSTNAAIEIISLLLYNEPNEYYQTILSAGVVWYLFPEDICQKIHTFAQQFLINCDYSQQNESTIKKALSILKHNNYYGSKEALEKCFVNISKLKKCRPFNILPLLLEGLTIEFIVSKIESERSTKTKPYSHVLNWIISDERNRELLSQQLSQNIIFDFVDNLIDKMNEGLLCDILSHSILHFAKKEECFADKVPPSEQFYKEILLDKNCAEKIDLEYLKVKSKEHKLSLNTALFHLCHVLKNEPLSTAYVCTEYLSKFFGQLEYSYHNPDEKDLYETHLFQKRCNIFPLLISNPVIRNTVKLYCTRMRKFAKILPPTIIEMITNIVQKDEFPEWLSDIETNVVDTLTESVITISDLIYTNKNRQAGKVLSREINERLSGWLETASPNDFYEPTAFILAIKEDDVYKVIDGNRAISHFVAESKGYGDFKIKIWVVELK
jgi:hypothetical protein